MEQISQHIETVLLHIKNSADDGYCEFAIDDCNFAFREYPTEHWNEEYGYHWDYYIEGTITKNNQIHTAIIDCMFYDVTEEILTNADWKQWN